MNLRDQRSDVGPMIGTWQGSAPQAYTTQGVLPDTNTLASWMQKMLETSGGLKLTRSVDKAMDPYTRARTFLASLGVDVERELVKVGHAREAEVHRARAAAGRAEDLALDLKAAEKRLLFEARGFNEGCPGFTSAKLGEAQARVTQLAAELEAACCDDPQLARSVRRSVA